MPALWVQKTYMDEHEFGVLHTNFEAFRKYGFEFEFTEKYLNDKERAHYFADKKKRRRGYYHHHHRVHIIVSFFMSFNRK